jgi:hypothetical protein
MAPNILLLVDTSGSMDYKTGSNDFPTCRYSGNNDTASPSERSRWIDLVEVLTGSVKDYQCQRLVDVDGPGVVLTRACWMIDGRWMSRT